MEEKIIYTIVTAAGNVIAKYPATEDYKTAEGYRCDWYKHNDIPVEVKATRVEVTND